MLHVHVLHALCSMCSRRAAAAPDSRCTMCSESPDASFVLLNALQESSFVLSRRELLQVLHMLWKSSCSTCTALCAHRKQLLHVLCSMCFETAAATSTLGQNCSMYTALCAQRKQLLHALRDRNCSTCSGMGATPLALLHVLWKIRCCTCSDPRAPGGKLLHILRRVEAPCDMRDQFSELLRQQLLHVLWERKQVYPPEEMGPLRCCSWLAVDMDVRYQIGITRSNHQLHSMNSNNWQRLQVTHQENQRYVTSQM